MNNSTIDYQAKNDSTEIMRHSCEHVMAAALMFLWPKAKRGVGPAIENGFYQDLEIPKYQFKPEDLVKIEKKMEEIKKAKIEFQKFTKDIDEAINFEKERGQVYKVEILEDLKKLGEKQVTYYQTGDYLDLCRGPHVEDTSKIGHFKLDHLAGAYWRGDSHKPMLQRVYGLCFATKEELEKFLWQREEAEKRDHKKIGQAQELFLISDEIGSGLPIFLPSGLTLRKTIENYLFNEKKRNGYHFVWTPHIARSRLYVKSGHWKKYEAMFNPMKIDEEEYVLKAMNCPHHFQVYLSKPRSYRDLPFRIAENGTVYRYEKSGVLNGLFRVRSATIDDTHTFLRHQQIEEEYEKVLSLTQKILSEFGFKKYKMRVSIRDLKHKEKYMGTDSLWKKAEEAIQKVARKSQIEWYLGPGEAAFYGPKLDIMIEDALGREWQCSTIQLDFVQPVNFEMNYIDENGQEQKTAVLHIAMLGSIERFMGILIEHYGGIFPLWLSPIQVKLIPISERHSEYAAKVCQTLIEKNIRVENDIRNESMQAKIRAATLQRIPYMGIIGDREIQNSALSIRTREGKDLGQLALKDFIEKLKLEIENKT